MALDTDIKKPKIKKPHINKVRRKDHVRKKAGQPGGLTERSIVFSPLARVIFLSHLFGLMILIVGTLTLKSFSSGLVSSRIENLDAQARLISSILADAATGADNLADLDKDKVQTVIRHMDLPSGWRVRVYDTGKYIVADSAMLSQTINIEPLGAIKTDDSKVNLPAGAKTMQENLQNRIQNWLRDLPWRKARREDNRRDVQFELSLALGGTTFAAEQYDDKDRLIITAAYPIARVQHIVGAVILETDDVEDIIAQQRRAFLPFIGLAIFASLISSIALTMSIVFPLRALSKAAENLSKTGQSTPGVPNFSRRGDEIGDLSVVFGHMTEALSARIDDVANFAADVAHEIKNPLTSLRSASDTLSSARTKAQRQKLINIIHDDVRRMDRLISDISRASKLDASLAREKAEIIDIKDVLGRICEFYQHNQPNSPRPDVKVIFDPNSLTDSWAGEASVNIKAFETPFAQVIRNLIDNGLTFSPKKGTITLSAHLDTAEGEQRLIIWVDDEGPGIPPDSLQAIFDRFYTQRPKGAQFGSHSGLGLAISRQIITAHKGTLYAENRLKDDEVIGARFIINIPRHGGVAE